MIKTFRDEDCPSCGEPMILRTNRHSGNQFWGCEAFPECEHTEPYEDTGDRENEYRKDNDMEGFDRNRDV